MAVEIFDSSPLPLALDGHRIAGLREFGPCQRDLAVRVAEGVAGVGGEFTDCADIARRNLIGVFLLLAADVEQLAGTFDRAGAGVAELGCGGDRTGDDLYIGELADKRVGDRRHDIGAGGFFGVALDLDDPLIRLAFLAGDLGRRREHRDHRAQQEGEPLLFLGGAAEDGGDGAVKDALVQALDQLQHRELFAGEVLFHQLVVGLGDRFGDCADQAPPAGGPCRAS